MPRAAARRRAAPTRRRSALARVVAQHRHAEPAELAARIEQPRAAPRARRRACRSRSSCAARRGAKLSARGTTNASAVAARAQQPSDLQQRLELCTPSKSVSTRSVRGVREAAGSRAQRLREALGLGAAARLGAVGQGDARARGRSGAAARAPATSPATHRARARRLGCCTARARACARESRRARPVARCRRETSMPSCWRT